MAADKLLNSASAASTWRDGASKHFAKGARGRQFALAAVVFALLSCLVFWPVQPFDDQRVVTCGCYDILAQTWYMAWAPHALLTGMNPFFTPALNVPFGVNLAGNTALPLLGVLTAPITWLIGPFASFNVLIRLAFCLSGLSMFGVALRWVKAPAAALLAGLLYGFSPYMFAQGSLHLNLTFIAVPPLILLVLDEIIVRRTWSARRSGLVLGVLSVAQYLITAEILADVVLVTALVAVLLAVRFPYRTWQSLPYLLTVLVWALLPFIVICGYPIAFALIGPQHIDVQPTVIFGDSALRADLLSPLVPTTRQLVGFSHWKALADSWVVGNPNENGTYLGAPAVMLFLLVGAFVREAFVRVLLVVAAISFALTLGPRLLVDGHGTGIWLPFSLLLHVPVVQIEVPTRYGFAVDLAVALVIAIGVDRFAHRIVHMWSTRSTIGKMARQRWERVAAQAFGGAIACLLAIAAVVALWPSGAIHSSPTAVPAYFTSAAVQQIPRGSTVLTYPYPIIRNNIGMAWQVESRFRFNLIGDYALTPFQKVGPPGAGLGGGLDPPTLDPSFVENFFEIALAGPRSAVPDPSPAAIATTRSFLDRYHVGTVIVDNVGVSPTQVVALFTKLFHRPPQRSGSVSIWHVVGR